MDSTNPSATRSLRNKVLHPLGGESKSDRLRRLQEELTEKEYKLNTTESYRITLQTRAETAETERDSLRAEVAEAESTRADMARNLDQKTKSLETAISTLEDCVHSLHEQWTSLSTKLNEAELKASGADAMESQLSTLQTKLRDTEDQMMLKWEDVESLECQLNRSEWARDAGLHQAKEVAKRLPGHVTHYTTLALNQAGVAKYEQITGTGTMASTSSSDVRLSLAQSIYRNNMAARPKVFELVDNVTMSALDGYFNRYERWPENLSKLELESTVTRDDNGETFRVTVYPTDRELCEEQILDLRDPSSTNMLLGMAAERKSLPSTE
ncbi:hypothetical protein IAU59_005475 [Kwoniella sp. CBS 9459]